MSLRRTLLTVFLATTTLLSACALRPRYKDLVVQPGATASAPGQVVVLRVVDPVTNRPVPGARVLAGDRRGRLSATSDAEGLVTLQVTKELLDENPLVEVVLPKGTSGYRLQLVPSGQAPAPEATPGQPAAPEAPAAPAAPEAPATPAQPGTAPEAGGAPDAGM